MSKIINFKTRDIKETDDLTRTDSKLDPREYSPDEVSDIIRHALQKVDNSANDSVVHSELLSIAEEFGLDESEIERAYEELLDQRDMEQVREYAKFQFKMTCLFIAFVAIVIIAVDTFFMPDVFFAIYALPGMLIAVLAGALNIKYLPDLLKNVFNISSSPESGSSPTFTTRKIHLSKWGMFFFSGTQIEKGILRIDGDSLLMEYRKVDSLFGMARSRVKEARIPLNEIVGVELDRNYWMSQLKLKAKSLKTFEDVPGESDGYLKLTFTPRARVAVINLARKLESHISKS
ncbi:MAG: hypothetical protein GKR91_05045 [Pseudomonadales bacterium]|nr:hypothetical protein [Pseudomonadales bacterium]